ncbi:DUF4296 domain-containing protein [Cesiribacter andamanensis]|uniref:DUF4296 domain-containing protein n=1 Tax=Cesiribacter andamanensis AMV16 TaxID=1279009 RepID=M7N1X0_9BACT|nr:DUF4296 domain-containing protein [Cesiribacter andamanensis]EMR02678.1 hypothetical protein ADICEAN_02155 [Cesiribacter andamanensis AMV16]
MNRLFLCLLALCCFSCDKTLGPPKGVLSERKMVSLLVELHIAEAKVKNLRVTTDSAHQLYNLYELQILDKHNVAQDKYVQSYQYYLENHRLMTRVQDAVLDTLLQRQQKLERMPEPVAEPPATASQAGTALIPSDSLPQRVRKPQKPITTAPVLRKQKDNQ